MVGSDGAVKVLDFGLAKLTADDVGAGRANADDAWWPKASVRPATIAGTAAYMSPEQASGGRGRCAQRHLQLRRRCSTRWPPVRGRSGARPSPIRWPPSFRRSRSRRPRLVPGAAARARAPDSAVPSQGAGPAVPDDSRRQPRTAGDQGGVRLGALVGAPCPARAQPRRLVAVATAVAAGLVIIAAAGWLLRSRAAPPPPAMRVVPLTSLNGTEVWPRLSPDGEQVAFSWDNGNEHAGTGAADHFDIYLKLVGASDVRRLTTDPGRNWVGGWSPDGRQIAVLHEEPQEPAIFGSVRQVRYLAHIDGERGPAQARRVSGLRTCRSSPGLRTGSGLWPLAIRRRQAAAAYSSSRWTETNLVV